MIFLIPFFCVGLGDVFLLLSFLFFLRLLGSGLDYCMFNDYMGFDVVSWMLVTLTFFLCYLIILSRFYIKFSSFSEKYFVVFIYLLSFLLLMGFSIVNRVGFYFFFEASLIPIFVLILG